MCHCYWSSLCAIVVVGVHYVPLLLVFCCTCSLFFVQLLRPQFFIFRFTDFLQSCLTLEERIFFYCHVKQKREMKGEKG